MKKFILLLAIISTQFGLAQNFHDTQGKLDISSSGQATYTLPIAMPPSIKDVGPVINLTYASGQMGGIAGQGWNISAISNISRIATRMDIDGFVDGVDFDDNDKLALDGQRLILKTGTYWTDGSTYQTEVQSNTKIELKGTGTAMYFIVTTPDGSRSWYGNYGGTNAVDLTAFYITRFEDANGNFMTYEYLKDDITTVTNYNPITGIGIQGSIPANSIYISRINFSANAISNPTPLNAIKFNYTSAQRADQAYIKGESILKRWILDNIFVLTNGSVFRKYQLTHTADTQLGYKRVTQIQESNGAGELANPVVFEYKTTLNTNANSEKKTTYVSPLNFGETQLSGDFDGDGRLDFTTDTQLFTNLFTGGAGQTPVTLPFVADKRLKFTATTITANKLNQFQSIVQANELPTTINFNVYNVTSNLLGLTYTKSINFNNTIFHDVSRDQITDGYGNVPFPIYRNDCYEPQVSNEYFEGDYNGDGISEVLIINKKNVRYFNIENNLIDNYTGNSDYSCSTYVELDTNENYLLNLDNNASNVLGSKGFVKFPSATILPTIMDVYNRPINNKYVADFNSDGKSDILVVDNSDKSYKIYSFKQLTALPWTELEILGQGTLDVYSNTKPFLFGDYNGDGKTDIMLPDTEGCQGCTGWSVYYSNPKPTGGEFFVKQSLNIVEYWPNSGTTYNTQTHFNNYYALDVNKDGKTDLVKVWRKHYKVPWTINNHNTNWTVTTFVNNIGNTVGNAFTLDYTSPCLTTIIPTIGTITNCDHDNDSPDIPFPVVSNYRYQGANTDLLMVRNHHNELTYVSFSKDVSQENLLSKVKSSGGNIVDEITYKTMEASANNGGFGLLSDFYSSNNSVNYPNVEIKKLPTNYLVSNLKNTTDGVVKSQDFKYNGYVVNLNGLGAVGFNKTARSAWYQNPTAKRIWSVTENNPLQRGATIRSYSQLLTDGSTFSFVGSGNPTGIINSSTNTFTTSTTNNIYSMLLSNQTVTDFITGVTTQTDYGYDPTYLLPLTTTTTNLLNGVSQGTTTVTNTFDSNPALVDANYYVGRPTKTTSVTTAYNDTFTTTQKYSYLNNKLSKLEKKGNATAEIYLTEEYSYDNYGNILSKTVSVPGATPALTPRTTSYTYDSTGRFIKTATDIEGLISTNNSYHALYGLVLSSTNPFGLTTISAYDNWGKPTKITDYLGKSIAYTYAKTATEYTTTKIGDDGSSSISISDALGRPKKAGSKNIDGTWSYKTTEYDFLGRAYRESEPYNSGVPTLWTTSAYDDYNRVKTNITPTGKTTTITYAGLTVSGTDDTKTTSSTKNANGHLVTATDNGGAINYTYYANGNLKTTNYVGTIISMEYDGWGRKTQLVDPSAGPYSYTYNGFGETLTETTPNGTTTYTLNAVGKLTAKTIAGTNTNSSTVYNYDATTKLPTSNTFTNLLEGTTITNTYGYDTFKRLNSTTEVTPFATFSKALTFDAFGRVNTETSTATVTATGKSSTKTIQNTYQNGYPYQIVDNTTPQPAVLWQTNTVNARGQLTTATLGNGIAITNAYDQYGFATQMKHDKGVANVMTLNTVFDAQRGNLMSRTNSLFGTSDTFVYDTLDRLTSYPNGLGQQLTQNYDDRGRITANNLGTYNYTNANKTYQNTSIATLTPEALTYYTARQRQNITYNTFKSPVEIEDTGFDKVSFTYNDGNDRSTMFYGGLGTKETRWLRKYYSADGTMEIKQNISTGAVEFTTYIGGDGYTAPIIVRSDGVTQKYLYLHRDYQGSILAITDANGTVLEKRLFDAWGNIAKVQDGNGNNLNVLTILDRGYTGHEHLQSVGLIHMNGRLYDPKLHRFLQPDNYVQDPSNTQNYNRYGYCWNNPLKFMDKNGEFLFIPILIAMAYGAAVGAGVAGATYLVSSAITGNFSWNGLGNSILMGAIGGAISGGISAAGAQLFTAGSWMLQSGTLNMLADVTSQIGVGLAYGEKLNAATILGSLAGAYVGAKMGNWSGTTGGWFKNAFSEIGFNTAKGAFRGAVSGFTSSIISGKDAIMGAFNGARNGAIGGAIQSGLMVSIFGATYKPTDEQLNYVKQMSSNSKVSYKDVAFRKGGLYQLIQPMFGGEREVTWGRNIVSFNGTTSETFGHEFGHIIQSMSLQGWATFQGKGIFEQLIWGIDAYNPYLHPNSNEVGADKFFSNLGN